MAKVIVLGGANIDIIGQSEKEILEYDSNPGKIKISCGGVGRNIAENLCHFNEEVWFSTVFGNDWFARELKEKCEAEGMNLSLCKESVTGGTSIYLAVLDRNQDMKLAISDMNLLKEVDEAMLENILSVLDASDILVLDTNLDQKVIEWMLEKAPCDVYMDPISCAKVHKVKHCLKKISTFKPNRFEAATLCGFEILSDDDKIRAVKWFLSQGVKEIFISLAEEGVIAANQNEIIEVIPETMEATNATGGGDSFLAALIAFRDRPLLEKAKLATAVAVKTIMHEESVHPELNREKIISSLNEIKMEGRRICFLESVKK